MNQIAKALVALLTALGTWGATAMADGQIDGIEAFGLCGVLVAGLAVWAVPNAPSSPDAGQVSLVTALAVVALIVAIACGLRYLTII